MSLYSTAARRKVLDTLWAFEITYPGDMPKQWREIRAVIRALPDGIGMDISELLRGQAYDGVDAGQLLGVLRKILTDPCSKLKLLDQWNQNNGRTSWPKLEYKP